MASLLHTIGKGTFWHGSGNLLLKVFGITTSFIILKHLSVYEYGLVALVLSVAPILSFFSLPGLEEVVLADMGVKKSEGDLGGVKRTFINYVLLQCMFGVVAWAILFFGSGLLSLWYEGQVDTLIKIVSFVFLLSPIRSMYGLLFNFQLKFFNLSVLLITEEIVRLGIVILTVLYFNLGTVGVVSAHVFSSSIAALILVPIFWRSYTALHVPHVPRESMWNLLLYHGKWGVFNNYIGGLGNKLRLWFLRFLLGTEAVGLFSLAANLIGHTSSLLPLHKVLTPIISQYSANRTHFYRIIQKTLKYQFIGFSVVSLGAFIVFPYVISFLFPHYINSITLFKVMLLAVPFFGFASTFKTILNTFKMQKDLFFITCLKTGLIITALPIMLSVFGILGASYEYVCISLVYIVVMYYKIRARLPGFNVSVRSFMVLDDDDYIIINRIKGYVRSKVLFFSK